VDLVMQVAGSVTIRGDTDFTNTADLDRWEQQGLKFIFVASHDNSWKDYRDKRGRWLHGLSR